MSEKYDVIVIGGGPAGYVAAIRAAQLGLNAACIDNWVNRDGSQAFGGTCLNAGCIPSKALLESSKHFERLQHEFGKHGIKTTGASMDVSQMMQRKAGITKQLTDGIGQLFKANKIEGIAGHGKLLEAGKVQVTPLDDGDAYTLEAEHVILACGSEPVDIPVAKANGDTIVDSWGALEFDEVPKTLGVIGGGVIGLELGSVWRRLGSEVTVIEALDDFLAIADRQIAKTAQREFKKQGLEIKVGARVTGSEVTDSGVKVEYDTKGGSETQVFDKLIVCVGRRPNTSKIADSSADLELDERGFIAIDDHFRTNLPKVYAVGDAVRGPMLAHKGMEEGVAIAEIIATGRGHVNYDAIPSIIYTAPEIAWVGKTEEELKSEGRDVSVGTFPFAAVGRAKAMEQTAGMVKFIADAETDRLLGVHIVGPMASELITEAVLALEYGASAEDIARTMHGHPTLGEAMHEAALSVDGRAIHGVNRKR